ncbi:MAG TPA: precorrin-8X methylmutase [Candidatus Limnocylindrales bacterium]|nr:precorrin-8X methylmutase [Candidatus Limnocylindrales bacterium]
MDIPIITPTIPMILDPKEITAQSFKIIEEKLKGRDFSSATWPIIRQVIHATADFEFADSLQFHPQAIDAGITTIRAGQDIVVDVRMVEVGINQILFQTLGGKVRCFITDPEVQKMAESEGITRSMMAIRKAATWINSGGIFVIGTAPTALWELIALVQQGKVYPRLIIGVPVGFVSTVESKEALKKLTSIPWITTSGFKGGSSVAVAIVNALLKLAVEGERTKK